MTPRKPIVAGNWKMNGDTAANSALLAALVSHADAKRAAARGEVGVVVCPPFPYLAQAGAQLTGSGFELGAQNLSEHDNGAFTGEVSGMMLLDIGCDWVIVGHSERRSLLGETDEIVAAKAARALGHDPVITYTLPEEGGASLRAAGFRLDKENAGGSAAMW
ncbi:MAG: triose-phosphate isomerase, partial [Quisquiliibacterium sp.]